MARMATREMDQQLEIADLADKLATNRRVARENANMLADAQHALKNGRYAVVEEYMERVAQALDEMAR